MARAVRNAVENNTLGISCAHEPMACAKNPLLEGGVGPRGLAGGATAAGVGAVVGEALNGDNDKTAQGGDQPNVGKNLSEDDKAELGGTGAGTPGGWGPEDEENARKSQSTQPNESDSVNSQSLSVAEKIGILRDAAKGNKGNFGLFQSTTQEANALGESWVGPGYRISKDGTTWVSQDGLRTYRPPTAKPNSTQATTGVQANFEQKLTPGGRPISNGHLDITK
ncbi:hypothetical protein [Candidatus Symbiopectobacterium sp. NZEC135]|uniref:hypothetical protein n=1 Tax=Candidatus Symbiopectobacterium sp. NZEC135 TaxID=2820471 RepID=UPI00222723FB|nr:hypothetical protein [Candidatus Symbiopectobacterium sp. NZEC135]MCW2481077.1 hypothetical protein [Candidatus Symbiopectobacterium sp. NZEC135]